jgi:amino acid permease
VKKLGPLKTYFTLLKGFVVCAVLTLPKSFVQGGWVLQIFAMTFSALLTIYCAMLLLEIRAKVNATSYTMIGEKTLGQTGK